MIVITNIESGVVHKIARGNTPRPDHLWQGPGWTWCGVRYFGKDHFHEQDLDVTTTPQKLCKGCWHEMP